MAGFESYLRDRNGDGFFDDIETRFLVNPAEEVDQSRFWSAAIDLAARIGLESQALPLPLFIAPGHETSSDIVELRDPADIEALAPSDAPPGEPATPATVHHARSNDLLDLFTVDGLLADLDGDLLPDATAFGFDLPDDIPAQVGAALCNLATRVGLESGGVTLPLVAEAERILSLRITDSPAKLQATGDGWLVEGEADGIAALLDQISHRWPHFGHPDTAGARYSVDWLARHLSGNEPGQRSETPMRWEMQWSARPETDRLIDAVDRQVIRRLAPGMQLDIVAFACEPLPVRNRLGQTLRDRLAAHGVEGARVRVLSAFKTGLSWLTEVVLPDLGDTPVSRLEIAYRRFVAPDDQPHLDLPIRWLQELFPGDEIAAQRLGIPIDAVSLIESSSQDTPTYRATAYDATGQELGAWGCDPLSYSMPFMPNVEGSEHVRITTGGFNAQLNGETLSATVDTDLDRFWRFWQGEVLPRLIEDIQGAGPFDAGRQPFFGRLEVDVWLSAPNSRLGIREENDSAAEALHEDIYFNTLDTIQELGLRSTGDRTSAPGPVIPTVHVQQGVAPHAIVRLYDPPAPRRKPLEIRVEELALENGELVAGLSIDMTDDIPSEVQQPISDRLPWDECSNTIAATVNAGGAGKPMRLPLPRLLADDAHDDPPPVDENLHGPAIEQWAGRVAGADAVSAWVEDYSYQGRPIPAIALRAPTPGRVWSPAKLAILKPTALIVARHHANEISSTNAAFQLAHLAGHDDEWSELLKQLNIVLIPYENADGAALHARLASVPGAETWKHHPARYNALGYEFGEDFHKSDTPFGESRVRPALWRRWLPDVLVDNHGVPSHEWVQPFAGFGSPPRFRVSYWIPQALIYGIIRYADDPQYPEHGTAAMALRDAVSAAFRETDIGDLNREIGSSYRRWGQERVPERFPGEFHEDVLWHIAGSVPDPDGRGFNLRHPATTVLSWVTEVNDETATGEHLETVARAHLLANRAMLDLLVGFDHSPERTNCTTPDGRSTYQFKRRRPLRLG